MGKGALKVLAVEYLSGLWICGDAKCLAVEDKCESVWMRMIILKVTRLRDRRRYGCSSSTANSS